MSKEGQVQKILQSQREEWKSFSKERSEKRSLQADDKCKGCRKQELQGFRSQEIDHKNRGQMIVPLMTD